MINEGVLNSPGRVGLLSPILRGERINAAKARSGLPDRPGIQ